MLEENAFQATRLTSESESRDIKMDNDTRAQKALAEQIKEKASHRAMDELFRFWRISSPVPHPDT